MGRFFSDAVETALQYLYYDLRAGKGAEAMEILKKASEEGDGDASCLLARCYGGHEFMWTGHNFEENYSAMVAAMRKSLEQGSALGTLVAKRCLTEKIWETMPEVNFQEAFRIILQKAEAGEPYCQYTIGNVYFWMDFPEIEGVTVASFPDERAFATYLHENMWKCEDWFLKSMAGGYLSAFNNLGTFYKTGNDGWVEPQPERVPKVVQYAAEHGHPDAQWSYGSILEKAGNVKEAYYWYEQAALGGQFECCAAMGYAYLNGKVVSKDIERAVEWYEKAVQQVEDTSFKYRAKSQLGYIYCDGLGNRQRDGEKAFPLLKAAAEHKNTNRIGWLGKCYFRGWGTPQDYGKARECFEQETNRDAEANYMLGVIYAQGLGVAEDIGKGVRFLKDAANFPEAKAELAKYKKPLFGKWTRV